MSQNLMQLDLSPDDWAEIDAALAVIDAKLAKRITVTTEALRRKPKMGDASEGWCREAVSAMRQNATILPPSVDVAAIEQDLAAHDALRPRLQRLEQLAQKASNADIALGSDIMSAALEGYAFLKIAGKGDALESLKRSLGERFTRTRGKGEEMLA